MLNPDAQGDSWAARFYDVLVGDTNIGRIGAQQIPTDSSTNTSSATTVINRQINGASNTEISLSYEVLSEAMSIHDMLTNLFHLFELVFEEDYTAHVSDYWQAGEQRVVTITDANNQQTVTLRIHDIGTAADPVTWNIVFNISLGLLQNLIIEGDLAHTFHATFKMNGVYFAEVFILQPGQISESSPKAISGKQEFAVRPVTGDSASNIVIPGNVD